MNNIIYYPVVVQEIDNKYKAYYPDIECLTSAGDTFEEILKNIKEDLSAYLYELKNENKEMPNKKDPKDIKINDNEFMFYADVNLKIYHEKQQFKSSTKAVTLPKYLNAYAVESGINVSAVLQKELMRIFDLDDLDNNK